MAIFVVGDHGRMERSTILISTVVYIEVVCNSREGLFAKKKKRTIGKKMC